MHVGRERLTAEGSKRARSAFQKQKFSVVTEPTTSQIVADAILTAARAASGM